MAEKLAIDVDEETMNRLNFIGESASVPKEQVAEEAVKAYALRKEQYIKAVRQGMEDSRNGKTTTHEELLAELESRLAEMG